MGDDPLETAAKGAVEGGLEWSSEKLWKLVEKFRNRELRFVEDRKNIESVRAQRETAEYKFLQEYLPKGYLRILCLMGLALREMVRDKDRMNELVSDIFQRYGTSGVHITELVQMGVITELLTRLVKLFQSPSDVQKRLTSFLEQIDTGTGRQGRAADGRHVREVVAQEDAKLVDSKSRLVKEQVNTNPIHMMIVFGSGHAKTVVKNIIKKLEIDPRHYIIEVHEDKFQITTFVFGPELKQKLTHWSDLIAMQETELEKGRE